MFAVVVDSFGEKMWMARHIIVSCRPLCTLGCSLPAEGRLPGRSTVTTWALWATARGGRGLCEGRFSDFAAFF